MSTETETAITDSHLVTSERDELIAAAKEAAPEMEADAAEKPAPTLNEDGTPKPVEVKPKDLNAKPEEVEEIKPPKSRLAAILRAREERDAIRKELEEDKKKHDYEVQRMRYEASQELEKAKAERARLEALRSRPIDAIKELGWDANNLVNEVTKEGDPVWQEIKRLRAELGQRDEKAKEFDNYIKQNQQMAEEMQRRAVQDQRAHVERTFLSEIKPESPLHTLYDPEDLIAMGDNVANKYFKATGKVASLSEIVEYLESRASDRLAARQEVAGAGGAAKVSAKKQRTLTSSLVGERRATPKPIQTLSASEERQALIDAAKDALRSA